MRYIIQVVCCTLTGCLTPLDMKLENQTGTHIVYGQVSTLRGRTFVQIGITAGVSRKPYTVDNAEVVIIDEFRNQYPCDPTEVAGTFRPDDSFRGEAGISYQVDITFDSGERLVSDADRMPLITGQDSLYYFFTDEHATDRDGDVSLKGFFNLMSKPSLPESEDPYYIRWSTHEIFIVIPTFVPNIYGGGPPPNCFVSQTADVQRIPLFNSALTNNNVNSGVLIAKRVVDHSFHTRHVFLSYMSSITSGAFDFWTKVDVVANQSGSIFDAPPAGITGNVHLSGSATGEVLGYFHTANEFTRKVSVTADDVPYARQAFCGYHVGRDPNTYPAECVNCLALPNSSYTTPPEWSN
jgi:hypothetical protein